MTHRTEVVDRQQWLEARRELLQAEKEHLRRGDELAARRRALPRVRVDRDYRFDSADGEVTLPDLFGGRRQLIVQHFMLGPDAEVGCPFCSFWADGYERMIAHLEQRDTSFVVVSRAPVEVIERYRERMGWTFRWVSAGRNGFQQDFGVSPTEEQIASGMMTYNYREVPVRMHDLHGTSVFLRGEDEEEGDVFHTYSTYGRGLDPMNAAYAYLDLTPLGRREEGLPFSMAWVKRRDEY